MRKPFKIILKSGHVIDMQAETCQVQRMAGELVHMNFTGSNIHMLHLNLDEVAAIIQPLICEPQTAESEAHEHE